LKDEKPVKDSTEKISSPNCQSCVYFVSGTFANTECPFTRFVSEVGGYRVVFPRLDWNKSKDFCSKFSSGD